MTELRFEEPPNAKLRRKGTDLDWEEIAEHCDKHPGRWVRVIHHYASERSARTSAAGACARYGLEYTVTRASPQEDGRAGLFVRYPDKEEW